MSMKDLSSFYRGKKVLVTGHTGFKGAWMSEWLLSMGADVVGAALPPNTEPALFEQLGLADRMEHHLLDINEPGPVVDLIAKTQPDVLFHLAAQPLVRYSYAHPVETFRTNVMGTLHVMEGLRRVEGDCPAVMVTTDKCYENRERPEPYREDDPMGGHDPYSASKGAAELAIASYRRSFFAPDDFGRTHRVCLASARAGNVIGGGDWACDRIVPDCVRMLGRGEPIPVRNARATRPWQHVLEPLGGYLTLALRLAHADNAERAALCSGFNFGPDPGANRPVRELVEKIISVWPGEWVDGTEPDAPHEAGLLNLTIDKADALLDWRPVWDFDQAVECTVDWYRTIHENAVRVRLKTAEQIHAYSEQLRL
jgi:CDP-glucose 4,6-dehydratase